MNSLPESKAAVDLAHCRETWLKAPKTKYNNNCVKFKIKKTQQRQRLSTVIYSFSNFFATQWGHVKETTDTSRNHIFLNRKTACDASELGPSVCCYP